VIITNRYLPQHNMAEIDLIVEHDVIEVLPISA
jgi:hypothetical protein